MNSFSFPWSLDWRRARLQGFLSLLVMFWVSAAWAQSPFSDPLSTSPRGDIGQTLPSSRESAVAPATSASSPTRTAAPAQPAAGSSQSPWPVDPLRTVDPVVFGSQMFSGRFGTESFSGFNPDYQIAVGDRVSVRMWGAFFFDQVQVVDAQGNIFVPNVGPVSVVSARNADLSKLVESRVKRVFRANVGVYASLDAAQPVKVYVTGFVRAPGLYSGLSSDSVLSFLDRAGGIDPERGSYLKVSILRGGKPKAEFNLYKFLLEGIMPWLQIQDGDTLVVAPRGHTVKVMGDVLNPYIFEFERPQISAIELLSLARARPSATHLSIVRQVGSERRSEYYPIAQARDVVVQDGDDVTVTADKYPGTILIRVEGAQLGARTIVLPYGSRLQDAVARLTPAPQANVAGLQLFRASVAARQKEMLETSLKSLETYALTSRSATSEEAALRTREADLILQFIERAKRVQPRGQVVLAGRAEASTTLLEDGDILRLPEASNLVLVNGEVLFASAQVFVPNTSAEEYVKRAGGYTQNADKSQLVVVHQDGAVSSALDTTLRPGDEVLVLPRIDTKNIEVTRGITQIVYQLAIAAKVAFGL